MVIVTRRDGEAVHIVESTLVAGKTVPDPPVRRPLSAPAASAGELLGSASRCWPASETEPLGDWLLRASGGFTRRANSALAAGDPGLPLGEALNRLTAWYDARGLTPYAQVAAGSALDREIAAHGWPAEGHTLVRTAPLVLVADAPGAERAHVTRELDANWLSRYHRTGDLADAAVTVLTGGPSVWFATVPDPDGSDSPAAIGRCAVDGRWAMFAAVEVAPAHRRQGLATAVMSALARAALTGGASGAFLQVETDNTRAAALYDRMGFTTGAGHHYRRGPGRG